jgi:hypothetical protein
MKNAMWVLVTVTVSFFAGAMVAKMLPDVISNGFFEWLHRWQELIGAFVGAAAISSTVWWTLSAERRKRDEQAYAMKVALSAEVRQYAAQALFGCQRIITHETAARAVFTYGTFKPALIEELTRFPDPIVYPNCASTLGTLGESAYLTVQFFNQISMIRSAVKSMTSGASSTSSFSGDEIAKLGISLLGSAQTAIRAMPSFAGTPRSEFDPPFKIAVSRAREFIKELYNA